MGLPRPQRGSPKLASKALGRQIIAKLDDLSRKMGTRVDWDEDDGVGVVSSL